MDARTRRLVYIAYDVRRWLDSHVNGRALNGQHDAVLVLRQLNDALRAFRGDVPPVNDRDRQEQHV